jgi:hypothetical protein
MSIFGRPQKSGNSLWIRDLTSIYKDGARYQRVPLVQTGIGMMLGLDEREWLRKAKKLRHEWVITAPVLT